MAGWEDAIAMGGGSGLGRASGAGLARRRARVWLSDLNGEAAASAEYEALLEVAVGPGVASGLPIRWRW
jgi:NAD(P)-dependent dehydrogenase (short-subunit alcohol dehydrogenase family)